MFALMEQTREPFVADEAEAVVARRAADSLKAVADANQSVTVSIVGPDANIVVPLPASAVVMLHAVLEAMANRTPISLIPHDAELSTQQAADFLNVSRPFLIRQLEGGALAYRKVGAHRRVQLPHDKFYPDFVAMLTDGRILVVEYKGQHLYDGESVKRQIGAVWQEASGGKCLFCMPTARNFALIDQTIG